MLRSVRNEGRGRSRGMMVLARLLLVLAGCALPLLGLELALRLRPAAELPLNNPYQFTTLVGARQFRVPLHSYREIYPLAFDHDDYYRRSDGAIDYHFDQAGGRWTEPRQRDLQGRVGIVVGDSFTLGFGLRYEDTYVFQVERALRERGDDRHLVNFAEPGADARTSLRNYLAVRDGLAHDLVLYGLHLNDLIGFPTSYVATETVATARDHWPSRLAAFVARALEKRRERRERIRHLTDPAQVELPFFRDNLGAIESMQRACADTGTRFVVVMLPMLVDLRAGTFTPVYAAIQQALAQRGIPCIDLTGTLDGGVDASYWILPFDQHPNERANAAFARRLAEALLDADAAAAHPVADGR
jgi:lysophospholipase L1-like esterase